MAMVVRANRESAGLGGHISTYASCATLFEVAFNHFLRARDGDGRGDTVFYQGHASPGVYARAFLEGRLSEEQLQNFRRECPPRNGLSSYPHPWLMPDFWEYPSVSMGLAPIMAIYQARFQRYLRDRGLKDTEGNRVWCFIGDGECDEPESLGSISLAAREQLDNLIFVVNCNLQRLDGPVRGNGKIIQELESVFRGAGWNVIKVIWGGDWDPLLEQDAEGRLVEVMTETLDGEYQKYSVEDGAYFRERFFGTGSPPPGARRASLRRPAPPPGPGRARFAEGLRRVQGGHAAPWRAHRDPRQDPEGLRARRSGRGSQRDPPAEEAQRGGAARVSLAVRHPRAGRPRRRGALLSPGRGPSRDGLPPGATRRPSEDTCRVAGPPPHPSRRPRSTSSRSSSRAATSVRSPRRWPSCVSCGGSCATRGSAPRVVPIIPDEARTFGMDALFRRFGIYSHAGQLYEPVDQESLLSYREAKDGQILEEGITEAGSMSSFIAAGTAYAQHGIEMVPFYTFYSMFGFQRVGDLIWAAADSRAKGFLLGGTAGRTTLAGEGLQHQDGHSHLMAATVPNLLAYDPAYAYEVAVIVREGLARMFERQEVVLYYLTLYNEVYPMPAMPEGSEEGILKGMYRLGSARRTARRRWPRAASSSSGAAPCSARRSAPGSFSPSASRSRPTCGA